MRKIDDAEAKELARLLAKKIFDEAETKRVFKEALNEWLDKRFEEFGKYSMRWLLASLFAALVLFVMWSQGYGKLR